MSILRIAHRYAESLFVIAKQDNILDKVFDDIKLIETLAKTDELRPFLKSPLIKVPQKQAVFNALLKDKVQNQTLQTVLVMTAHKRESYLLDFCTEFEEMQLTEMHISLARLVTAEPITDEKAKEITSEFQAAGLLDTDVRLQREVKPEIMGGFVLYFKDQVYDASVAYKLELLENKFSENLYIKNF
jgi:F-type H+-transporting ATPase subunit delta